jgi:hypothetical protein
VDVKAVSRGKGFAGVCVFLHSKALILFGHENVDRMNLKSTFSLGVC